MNISKILKDLKPFLLLWITQMFSSLGSSMTNFALIIWSYQAEGSALTTALLSVCSYAPYVAMSIFAGALSDRWNKKLTMILCDAFAAFCTVAVLVLLYTDMLRIWHLYVLNAVNGLMNTVQQPAADVTTTLLIPEKHYQTASGLKSLSSSVTSILTPALATALLMFFDIKAVIAFDLVTFALAALVLALFIKIPEQKTEKKKEETVLQSAKVGVLYLRDNRGIFCIMIMFAAINLIASVVNAAMPALILSRAGGGEAALGAINTVTGIVMLVGSLAASAMPAPKSRVRVMLNCLLISMSVENFALAFGKTLPVWIIGAVIGWCAIPLMNANLDVIYRTNIPVEMQGRVFAARNTFQYFTIPIGYFLGGWLVDDIFEPLFAKQETDSLLVTVFGAEKGAGAAMLFAILAVTGIAVCLAFRCNKNMWALEKQ